MGQGELQEHINNNEQVLINLIHVQDKLIDGHSNIIKILE